jgi:hypothetical protein
MTTRVKSGGISDEAVTSAKIADNSIAISDISGGSNLLQGRNRIINGAMEIAQRGTSAVTATGSYPVDRFPVFYSMDGAVSVQQDSSAPAGFINSTKFTTTTADTSLSASQYVFFQHKIEGTNIADLAWGTASAKTVTLSFWVRSSLTGTFSGSLVNSGFNRSYPFTYSISAADTWEQKSITIAGDTTGTWLTTNGVGIRISWSLGVGSNFQGTANTWAGAEYYGTSSETPVIGTLNATWYITGVQLEAGSVATSFERRSYGQELALCQRYYYAIDMSGIGGFHPAVLAAGLPYLVQYFPFPSEMRAAPSCTTTAIPGGGGSLTITVGATKTHALGRYDQSSAGFWASISTFTASAEL